MLLELAKRMSKLQGDLYYVFTVQEEFGVFGSTMSAYKIDPDWAIAVDVTSTDESSHTPSKQAGKGPCLTLKDADTVTNKSLNDWIRKVAGESAIPLQLEVSDVGVTDAFGISVARGGVPSTRMNVPMRNIETAIGIVHKTDIKNTIALLELLLKHPQLNLV